MRPKDNLKFIYIFIVFCLTFAITACSGSTAPPPSLTGTSLGVLPNGSTVWVSQDTFTLTGTSSTTSGVIGVYGGEPNHIYQLSFTVNPSGPTVTSIPSTCIVVSGVLTNCQLNFAVANASTGNYTVTVAYNSLPSANLAKTKVASTSNNLPTTIKLVVTRDIVPTLPPTTPTPSPTPSSTPTPTPSSTPTPIPVAGTLVISPLIESTIAVGESTTAIVTLSGSSNITAPVFVTISSTKSNIANITPTSCALTTESNYCNISLLGVNPGTIAFNATASGYQAATSESLVVTAVGVIFGNEQGLVYKNNTLLAGNVAGETLDFGDILALIPGKNGTLYASTNAANGGHVFAYDPVTSLWTMLPNQLNTFLSLDGSSVNALALNLSGKLYGATTNGSVFVYATNTWQMVGTQALDGSSINSLIIDSNNTIYAGTANGNVFKYSSSWQQLSGLSGGAVMALTLDSSNNIYAGTSNGTVAKYVNNSWQQLHVCPSQVNSLIISHDNIVYAGTSDGTVWQSGTSWVSLSSPDNTSVNVLTLDKDNNLYAGTSGPLDGLSGSGQVYEYASSTWNRVNNLTVTYNNTIGWINYAGVSAMVIESNNTIFAATNSFHGLSTYATGAGLVFANSNVNESWQITGSNSVDGTEVNSVATDKNGNYYVGTDLGVYTYSNESWINIIPYSATDYQNAAANFASIVIDSNGNIYAGTFLYGLISEYIKQTESVTLLPATPKNSSNGWYHLVLNSNNNLYLAYTSLPNNSSPPYVYKYVPESIGEPYQALGSNGPNDPSYTNGVSGIVIDSNNNIFVAANKQVWEYPNSGNAWIPVGTQTPDSGAINSLALDQQNNLYIATYNGFNGYVFKYISSSCLWQVLGTGIFNGVGIVTTDSSGNLYIVAPSTNNGLLTTVSTYSGDAFLPSYSGNYAPLFGNNAVVTGM